ncbi:DEAD/DEAH box helicase [Sphingobacterium paramultivorum]|uniref:DEAD/DEAH box helicase n=1 Tax=Sphingobacterium paramultivorum TaxID=2886510 RepID=UPI00129C6107|nr:DEAD/DEAH box helicase [Sphingobacterium paramultivorum]
MKIIDKLTEDILRDEYFIALFNKCSLVTAQNLFKKSSKVSFTTKELRDTLRFADILSNSKNSEARNRSYKIVASLNQDYSDNEVYRTVSKAVFSKLGNFPAINYLESKNNNTATLPIFREIETESKKLIQQAPDGNGMIFTDTQFRLFNKLAKSTEFSFSGPTSMGKSFIIKSFIKKVIKNSPPENIVIIVPTRALINQFFSDLKNDLDQLLEDYKYKIFINSNVSDILTEEKYNYIFVLTPERLLSYLSQDTNPPIGFLFVDEAHKLANDKDSRSVTTYSAIEKVQKKYGNVKLYFSSPNVSNPEIFLKLFNRDVVNSFRTGESPVSQNIYFVNLESKEVESYANNNVLKLREILDDNRDYSISEFIKFIGTDKNNLIYCYSKRNTVNKAVELSRLLPKNEQSEIVQQAIKNIKEYIHPEYYLVDFIEKGVAYHYGKLPQLIRNLIEDLYQKEEIRYVFCTSTLLEGVNMPTQNIFIIDNRSGSKTTLSPIDFWNLSGRAGRLTRELEGNIFCVQYKDFQWVDKDVLIRRDITLQPTILTKIDHNLKKIEKALKNEEIKSGSEVEKEILKYIANIIKVDTLETTANYKSPIIDKLIEDNKQKIIDLAKKGIINFEIPKSILKFNQTINFEIQEKIYKALSKSKKSVLPVSGDIKYTTILKVLNEFYKLYSWNKTEKKLANLNSLKYYAVLMNQWIQGFSLSQIISQSIEYNHENGYQVEVDSRVYEIFDKTNRRHINALIEKLIDDIEYVLRYILEKYFNHYYQILVSIIGESRAGDNWATLLEYGTQIPQVIALQNIGLSRNTSIKIFRSHRKALILKDNKLVAVNKALLLSEFRPTSLEFEEIKRTL